MSNNKYSIYKVRDKSDKNHVKHPIFDLPFKGNLKLVWEKQV